MSDQVSIRLIMGTSKSLQQSLQVEESLLEVKENGSTAVVIVNNSLRKAWNWAKLLGQQ